MNIIFASLYLFSVALTVYIYDSSSSDSPMKYITPILCCAIICIIDLAYAFKNLRVWDWRKLGLQIAIPCGVAMLSTAIYLKWID